MESPMSSPKRRRTSDEGTEQAEPPRRLMISKMTLENFKSYAGLQEIGDFHHCFSSVVGPNGSGKSNVIDAMLFVFGKRAKQLRLNKIRELIHKSDQCQPNFATVTVYMQEIIDIPENEKGDEENTSTPSNGNSEQLPYRVVPNSQVILSRTAKSDNTSVYKLNGKNTQFKEIASFLKTKGIDLEHNRFLILQGEVELISMMPPKGKNEGDNDGLLEYLEDIIGSHKFVPATLEAEAQVEALTATRQEKLNRVKAVEQETKALESAKEEAQSLLRRERDIRQHQNILHQVQRLRVTRSADALQKQKESLEAKVKECREQSTNATKELDEMKEHLKEQAKQFEKVNKELQKTEEDFTAYERRHIKLQETIKHNKQKVKDANKKIGDQDKKVAAAEEKISSAQERIPQLEEEIQDLEQSKEEEDAKLKIVEEESRQKTQQLRTELEAKTEALQPLRAEKVAHQAALDTAQTELELVQNRTLEAQKRLKDATQELDNLDATKKSKKAEVSAKSTELKEAKDKVQALEREEQDLASKEVNVSTQQKTLVAQVEEVKAAIQSKGSTKTPKAVKALLQASRNGGPLAKTGILGRLGDLATIEAKYDVAVSTACGGYLNHLVVQTTAGAQHCLEFLRKHNLGRANFIPLDKMSKGAHDRVVETPEQAPRLLDLIQPVQGQNYSGVMSALSLAAKDTIVAPDLETATRWAYDYKKRWRVVTIDGKLLETAGTMTGGGKEVKKGGMRLRGARAPVAQSHDDDGLQDSLKKLESDIATALNTSQQIRKRRKEIVEELRQVKKQIKEIERLLPKLTLEIEGCDTTRENLTDLIPQLKEQSKLSDEEEERVQNLAEEVKQCKKVLTTSEAKSAGLETEVSKLQKAILDAGGSELKKQQAKCDKIVQSIKEASKSLSSSKVSISSGEKAIKKAEKAKADAEKQLQEVQDDLVKAEEEFESLQSDAVAVKEAYEKVKEAAAAKKIEYEEMGQAVEKVKESHAGLKGKEIELEGQIDSTNKTLSDHIQKIRHFDMEIKKILKKARKDEPELWEDDDDVPSKESEENDMPIEDSDASEEGNTDDSEGGEKAEEVDKDSARLAASYPELSEDALDRYEVQELKDQIETLETERNSMAKNANLGAIAEFRKKEADYLAKVAELDEVTEERNKVRREHEDLRRKRLEMFMDGFSQITLKLKEMYQMITLGGDAELELVDSLDPFSEGIVFSVRPPKKSWKNISNLSGGEKTLSSLALVFALHHYKPTPLYVMDEIDAALDYKNVSIVANYIKERTKNAQFIIISLRNNMFELADRLVGIYKTQDCSKSVAVDPNAFNVESNQNGVSATPALRNRTNSNIGGTSSVKKTLSTLTLT